MLSMLCHANSLHPLTMTAPRGWPGVQVFDSCGRTRVAASHLGELLPMLRGDDGPRPSADAQPPLQLGLIDGAGLLTDAEVRDTLEHFQVPVVTMDADTMLVAAGLRAKASHVPISALPYNTWFVVVKLYSDFLQITTVNFATKSHHNLIIAHHLLEPWDSYSYPVASEVVFWAHIIRDFKIAS
jgi:hypothetical protein